MVGNPLPQLRIRHHKKIPCRQHWQRISWEETMSTKNKRIDRTKASADPGRAWKYIVTLHLGVLLLLSLPFVLNANAQQVERQDFGSGGTFSYVPPNGWTVTEFPGLKFQISRGAPVKGFAPNIVVADEAYKRSLDDYAKDNLANLQKVFHGLKVLGQNDFTTSDGSRVVKLLTERDDDVSKKRLRQVFYFYDAGNKKLVASCSSLAEEAPASDLVCDSAMKTFRVTPASR
jgi:hypothetical protein